jgi:hypothetical protein
VTGLIMMWITGMITGFGACWLTVSHFFDVEVKKPYVWKCSECTFRIATSSGTTLVLEVAEDHKQKFHQGA